MKIVKYAVVCGVLITSHAHAQSACDSTCLTNFAAQYMAAFAKRDPGNLPVAPSLKAAENSHRIALGENAWQTVAKVHPEKMVFTDPVAGQVVRIGVFEMNAAQPFIYVLRLKIVNQHITESEMMVTSDTNAGQHFNPEGITTYEPLLTQEVPSADQDSRETLLKVADEFWTSSPDFRSTADCVHTENGERPDFGRPRPVAAAAPSPGAVASGGCPAQRPVGHGSMFTAERGVRTVLADTAHGIVITYALQDATPRPRQPPAGERTPLFYQHPVTFYVLNLIKVDHGLAKREAMFGNVQEPNAPLPFPN